MLMGAARGDFSSGTLNFRIMASPDPFMGKDGYPLLFAAGETANGTDTLIDRQHPHDLLMELSASYSHLHARYRRRRLVVAHRRVLQQRKERRNLARRPARRSGAAPE